MFFCVYGVYGVGTKQGPIFSKVGNKRQAPDPHSGDFEAEKGDVKKFCFRCFTKGPATADCQAAVFCETCESDEHVKQKCPIAKIKQ